MTGGLRLLPLLGASLAIHFLFLTCKQEGKSQETLLRWGHRRQPSPLAVGMCCHPTAPRSGAGRGLWPLLPARSPSGEA